MNLKLSIKRSSFLTLTYFPSLFLKFSATTSLLKLTYFSSLFGIYLMFPSFYRDCEGINGNHSLLNCEIS